MENIDKLIEEYNSLPNGYISKKRIKGKIYFYLQHLENGKIVSKYIHANEIKTISEQLKRRDELKKIIKSQLNKKPRVLSSRESSFTGFIMMGDTKVATFENGYPINIDLEKCPLYIKRTKDIQSYFANRILDLSRPNARVLLKVAGINDKKEELISLYSHGLTISDNYWFKPLGSKLKYKDVSFKNDFYSDLALKGQIIQFSSLGSNSPEFTNIGSFEKCWKLINGEWWLYKKGDDDQIFSELFSSKLAKALGIATAEYECADGYIRTKNFADKYNFEPMYALAGDNEKYKYVFDILYSLGEQFASDYLKLLYLDALTYNVDRHNNNYGIMRDKISGKIISLAPNFDNNLSLFAYNKTLNQKPENDALIKIFVSFIKSSKTAFRLYRSMNLNIINNEIIANICNSIEIKKDINLIANFVISRYDFLNSIK